MIAERVRAVGMCFLCRVTLRESFMILTLNLNYGVSLPVCGVNVGLSEYPMSKAFPLQSALLRSSIPSDLMSQSLKAPFHMLSILVGITGISSHALI